MTNSCGATTLWAREFWSEIVNRRSILSRHGDEVDLLGWKVRLAWDEGADRGTLYVRPRNVAGKELDRRIFICKKAEPMTDVLVVADVGKTVGKGHFVALAEAAKAHPLPHVPVGAISGFFGELSTAPTAKRAHGLASGWRCVDEFLSILEAAVLLGFAEVRAGRVHETPSGRQAYIFRRRAGPTQRCRSP